MSLPIEKHIEFYKAEYAKQLREWQLYYQCEIRLLLASGKREMYVAAVWGIEPKSGMLILKIRSTKKPRLNQPYFFGLVSSEAIGSPKEWTITYKEFRERNTNKFYTGMGDGFVPINYWKSEGEFTYLLCEVFNDKLVDDIKASFLERSIHPLVLIAKADPPLKYLENLKKFLIKYPEDEIANYSVPEDANWNPQNLDNSDDVTETIINSIRKNKTTLVQGPPGTGKSYLAASIANKFVYQNKSVLICSLANKALIEIVNQTPLQPALTTGKVYKTNRSNLERRQNPKLQKINDLTPIQGQLLLTTYYSLSNFLEIYEERAARFDLIIVEEASQAFLATIAMFSAFSKRVLVIGDYKQIPPVVLLEIKEWSTIYPKLSQAVNGLETISFNLSIGIFRLTKTRRLTVGGANLTGLFYDNSLKSISPLNIPIESESDFSSLFDPVGSCSVVYLPLDFGGVRNKKFVDLLLSIAQSIMDNSKELEVGIISSKRDLESILVHEYYLKNGNLNRLNLSTVHRAQGLTVDYCIFYMPLEAAHMDLDPKLFNVATSRAKKGTCIITNESFSLTSNVNPQLATFISNCTNVTKEFSKLLNPEIKF
jgi:DNA replication ATP-dependent helicase Dna2